MAGHPYDTLDLIQAPEFLPGDRERIQERQLRGFVSLLHREVLAQLAHKDNLAVLERSRAAQKEQVARAHRRNV